MGRHLVRHLARADRYAGRGSGGAALGPWSRCRGPMRARRGGSRRGVSSRGSSSSRGGGDGGTLLNGGQMAPVQRPAQLALPPAGAACAALAAALGRGREQGEDGAAEGGEGCRFSGQLAGGQLAGGP
eukprot:scaffold87784_cov36-Phaeocystis_antarctica.AAC.1